MNPLSPKQILRNLENGFFMTHQEQTEAAEYIRQLQQSNQALTEGMLQNAEEVVRLRRDLHNATGFTDQVITKRMEANLRQWVGLTIEDITGHICDCADDDGTYKTSCFIDYAKAIEQKLKDLNTASSGSKND
jgi:hypothetical protein